MKGNRLVTSRRARTKRSPRLATMVLMVVAMAASSSLLQGQNDGDVAPTVDAQPPFDALQATARQRRRHIERMSLVEKERLRRQSERFAELDGAEKRQLRRLQQDLAATDDREELVTVMRNYQIWLSALSPSERAEFLELPPDGRITRIRHINSEERRHASDMEALATWIERRMIQHAPPERKRQLSQLNSQQLRKRLAEMWVAQRKQDRRSPLLRMNEEGFEELGNLLSDEARRELEAKTLPQKRQLLIKWINKFAEQYTGKITPVELRRFYRDLSQEEREKFRREFSTLPPEEIRRKLETRYLELHPYDARDFRRDRPVQRKRPGTGRPDARDDTRPVRDRPPKSR